MLKRGLEMSKFLFAILTCAVIFSPAVTFAQSECRAKVTDLSYTFRGQYIILTAELDVSHWQAQRRIFIRFEGEYDYSPIPGFPPIQGTLFALTQKIVPNGESETTITHREFVLGPVSRVDNVNVTQVDCYVGRQ
jgi:hypothetical protein